jgi:calcium-dependent protein kinase
MAAVKTIDKSRVNNLTSLEREVELLREVHHPHIIQLYDIYEDYDYLHLVTELCTGGELYDKVIEKTESEEGHFSEDDAACLIRDILEALRYIHDELHIVHRDLKPENFLLSDNTDDARKKIRYSFVL